MVVPTQTKSGAFLARQAAKYAADSAYQLSRMKKLPGLANGITSVLKRNAYIQGEVAKPLDTFLKRSSRASSAIGRAADVGSAVTKIGNFFVKYGALLTLIASIGVAVFINELQGFRNDQTEKGQQRLSEDLSKVLGKLNQYQLRIEANQAAIKEFIQQDQRTRDRIYSIEKQQPKIREDANNALYEARQGRKILERQIENSTKIQQSLNSRLSQLQTDFSRFLGGANNNFQTAINSTINNIQTSLNTARTQSSENQRQIASLNSIVNGLQTKIAQLTQIRFPTIPEIINQVTPTVRAAIAGDFLDLRKQIAALRVSTDLLSKKDTVLADGIKNVATQITTVDGKIEQIKRTPTPIIETPPEVKRDLDTLKLSTNQLKIDIGKLDTKIKERETVDKEANRKLDQIIPMLGGIPLIPGRVIDGIRPNLLTPPQIEQATGNAICKSLNGGCGKASVDDAVNRVNANNTNNTGAVLDAINTGANAALLQGQQTILTRLGDQLPGGIGGKLDRVAKWLHLDRALNILIWWQTLHNAYMLSANLGQTLTSAISNVLAAIGIKDAEGSPLDIGTILGGQFDNLAKTVIGESEWGSIKAEYKKWNRIYQAAANLMNSIQSIGYSILSTLEVVGSWVASIGNALRRWGEVGETAYRWMNPTPNFQNKFFTTLENVENVVSQVDQVASEVLSVQETVTQIGQQKDEFTKALGQEPESKQSTTPPEAIQVKAGFDASKLVSVTGLAISDNDKEADE